jgi:hypothetical protein
MGIRFDRVLALSFSVLFAYYALYSCIVNVIAPKGIDFVSFWAAAKLAVEGTPSLAYDVAAHHAMELTAGPVGLLPFPYPPPFLFAVLPLGLTSNPVALPVWLALGTGAYAFALRDRAPLPYLFAHPAGLPNAALGQTGLLTTAVFGAGLTYLEKRPFTGGALFGLLIVKPQLALIIPFAMIAGREWRAILGGVATACALILAALVVFGPDAYAGFLEHLPVQASFIRDGRVPWEQVASVYALLRWSNAPESVAFAVHGLIAIIAVTVTCKAWASGHRERGPTLAAATLLISPYLFTYDTLLLILPMIALWKQGRFAALAVVWLTALLPVIGYALVASLPNTAVLAAMVCLWSLRSESEASFCLEGRSASRFTVSSEP